MVYIKESIQRDQTVIIQVDGILDSDSIPILKSVCDRNLTGEKEILLNLEGLFHICREGIDFLTGLPNRIRIVNPPNYTKLEIQK